MYRATLAAVVIVTAGCGSRTEPTSAPPAASTRPGEAAPATTPAAVVPAPAVTQASWAPDALDELLAPIALYPDALLGQILAASVNSQEVLDAGNWLLQNQNLTGDELDAAAQEAGFGPATRALVQFPTVVDMMCQQIDWTRQLGSAFTSDQKSVLDAVQRLRTQAADVGNLKSTPEQKVETKEENNRVIVEVKPADPTIVYVPQYDPQQVYTTSPPVPPSQETPPAAATSSSSSTVSTGAAVAGGLLAFGVGIALGHALDDDDCYPHWGAGVVYYGPRPFYPPAYVYRPVYGPTFHPAYRYAPPPGYRHSYNNVNVNVNRNIVVNNNNYFNRFDNNQNLRVNDVQSPLGGTRRTATQDRVGQSSNANRTDSWRGQSAYAGTRDQTRAGETRRTAQARTTATPARTAATQARSNQDRMQHVDRGYGESTRVANRDAADRADRGSGSAAEVARQGPREHALSGATREGSGAFEQAASARGRASAGAHSAHTGRAARRR